MLDVLIRIIADGLVVLIVLAGAFAFLFTVNKDVWQQYIRAIMAGLSAFTIAKLMSLMYQEAERPFVTMGVDAKAAFLDNPGFPSDHALFVATITLVIAFTLKNRKLTIVLAVLSVLVGVGRVLALVHTPADVVGGFVAALLGVAPWYVLHKRRLQ